MRVDDIIADLIKREGGYVDHPNDRGGPTMYGITQVTARAFGYTGEIRDLSVEEARRIYLERYWKAPRFDAVFALTPAVGEELLDTGVNMGQSVAATFLQRALNVLNLEGRTFPDVARDGNVGNLTLAALDTFLKARGKDGETVLLRMLNAQQSVRYMELAEGRPSQEDFVFGWNLNRVRM